MKNSKKKNVISKLNDRHVQYCHVIFIKNKTSNVIFVMATSGAPLCVQKHNTSDVCYKIFNILLIKFTAHALFCLC